MKTLLHTILLLAIWCAAVQAQTPATSPHQPRNTNLTNIAALTTTAFGRSVLEAANAAALQTLADLPAWVGTTNVTTLGTITTGVWNGTAIPVLYGGTGATTQAAARTNLGLVIGTNVQQWNTKLDALAGVANSAGVYTNNGSGTMSITAASATPVVGALVKYDANGYIRGQGELSTGVAGVSDVVALSGGEITISRNGFSAYSALYVPGRNTSRRQYNFPDIDATSVDLVSQQDTGTVSAAMLASTAVTPGSYTSSNITVDADGRITAASNGSSGLTIDSTAISGGASQGLLYHKSDNTVGEATGITLSGGALSGLALAAGTLTASAPVTMTQTWNNAAVAFTGLDVNITETAAAGLSTYMRVRSSRSAADIFKLQYSQYGTYTDLSLGGTTSDASAFTLRSGYGHAQLYAVSLGLYSDSQVGFVLASSNGTVFTYLTPSAAKLFQRNSTTAQAFNVCNTYTSTVSFESMSLDWSSDVGRVGTLKGASGGSAREWVLHYDGTEKARVSSSGFTIGSSGTAVSSVLSAVATKDFNLTAVIVEDLTMTVTGAAVGDVVSLGVPHGSVTATAQFTAWVSATDTITIRCRTAIAGENPASGSFRATVTKH